VEKEVTKLIIIDGDKIDVSNNHMPEWMARADEMDMPHMPWNLQQTGGILGVQTKNGGKLSHNEIFIANG
jgi:hypothetical protein